MKAKRLSAAVLFNTIRGWGLHCKNDPNCNWTKHDSNAMVLLLREVKRQRHERYLIKKAVEINPYIDKDNPYHTT